MSFDALNTIHQVSQLADELWASAALQTFHPTITQRQAMLLWAADEIARTPGHNTQQTLAAETGIDRSTLSELVRRMIKRGWITRRRNRHDARGYTIELTADGRAALNSAIWINAKALAAMRDRVSGLERISINALDGHDEDTDQPADSSCGRLPAGQSQRATKERATKEGATS